MWGKIVLWIATYRELFNEGSLRFEYEWYLRLGKFVLPALALFLVVPFVLKYSWRTYAQHRGVSPRFFSGLAPRWADLMLYTALLGMGVFTFFTVLGPSWQRVQQIPQKKALKVIVAMDGSGSTLAPVRTGSNVSRWELMKRAVHEVFKKLPDDIKGFFIFAEKIISESALLTTDYERMLKPQLNEIDEWFLADAGQGTNFAWALRGCFQKLSVDAEKGVCIILSDGEQQGDDLLILEEDLAAAIKEVKAGMFDKGLRISFYIVPVGDPAEWQKIPKRDFDGNIVGFVCCGPDGRSFVETKPDYAFLDRIARVMEGKFIPLERGDELVAAMQDTIDAERKIIAYHPRVLREDLSIFSFGGIGICALIALFLWRSRKNAK